MPNLECIDRYDLSEKPHQSHIDRFRHRLILLEIQNQGEKAGKDSQQIEKELKKETARRRKEKKRADEEAEKQQDTRSLGRKVKDLFLPDDTRRYPPGHTLAGQLINPDGKRWVLWLP